MLLSSTRASTACDSDVIAARDWSPLVVVESRMPIACLVRFRSKAALPRNLRRNSQHVSWSTEMRPLPTSEGMQDEDYSTITLGWLPCLAAQNCLMLLWMIRPC